MVSGQWSVVCEGSGHRSQVTGRLFIFLFLFLLPLPAAAGPVVVELFTSQGCVACPPADEIFGELIEEHDDILALSFHVDYWDQRGWKDPFSLPEATDRQRSYAGAMGSSRLFTPQVVVDGQWSFIGTKKKAISEAIRERRHDDDPTLPVTLEKTAKGLKVQVMPDKEHDIRGEADIWLATYSGTDSTRVQRGENWGHTLTNHRSVKQMLYLGKWNENPLTLDLDFVPDAEGAAVLVQRPNGGRIVGAAMLKLGKTD